MKLSRFFKTVLMADFVSSLFIALKEMFKTIIPANDAKKHLSFSVPSLLVQGLKIAGK